MAASNQNARIPDYARQLCWWDILTPDECRALLYNMDSTPKEKTIIMKVNRLIATPMDVENTKTLTKLLATVHTHTPCPGSTLTPSLNGGDWG